MVTLVVLIVGVRFFCVYKHKESGRVRFVRDGFSILAFVFVFFFTAFKRLWALTFILLVASCVSYTAYHEHFIDLPCYALLELVIKLYAGLSYPDWLRMKLRHTKHAISATVLAHNTLHARLRFMEQEGKASDS
ncbi:Erum7620/ECH_0207 family putative T1SS effector [Anaplasma capra]|uniref:Erum7620/ECH_0207 family putative T1SS effector n=1 Tax=Anaplasma capra TaxID=1562740 RepID=UPI0021D5EB37|nr:DUF2628 domain-containing protein [Anaplasma capra]MCU7611265.1 DUF2628 domain-containing protein [Anaplasma capra]MCU7612692.1 DUF2628 domain-containing protein [Anaplasma capra]